MKYSSQASCSFPPTPSLPSLSLLTVVRFPHHTRDIGSVPLVGHGRVKWEPALAPHNNCLALAVPPVTQSNSDSDSKGKWKRTGHQGSESKDEKSPKDTVSGSPGGYANTRL